MKQILLFLFVTFFFLNATAQTEECGTKIPENTTFEMASPYGLINEVEVIESFVQKHIPLALHIVQTTNGTGGLSGTILNQALTLLDAAYIQANIDFYQYSLDYINNDNYYNIDNQIEEDAIRQINVIPNAINVYFVNGFGSTAGLSSFTFSPIQGIIIKNSAATGSTFPHEIGHYFNLFHTHQTGIFTGSGWTNYEKKENIVRELESPCFNANRRGDLLIDTEADHNLLDIGGNSHVNNNCEYAPFKTFVDDCGNSNYSPNVRNIMSYSLWACRDEFTLQQIWRMHYTIENQRSELIPLRVTLKNIYNNELTGTYLKVDNTNYVSGSIVPLVYDGSYNIGTVQQKLQSNAIQHHDWNQLYHDFYISRLVTVGESKNLQDARFHDIRPIKIYSKVDGIPIGNFEFKDKWFIESNGTQPGNWKSYSGEFTPGSGNFVNYGGLFLDEEGENSYKIKFPSINQIQTQQGIRSGYFLGWSTNNVDILTPNNIVNGYYESPVIFQQANSEMAGNYKGSLISNNSNAYDNNSQRKIVSTESFDHHVYESMGSIWYEKRNKDTGEWQLANGGLALSTHGKCPSITQAGDNNIVIVFQEKNSGESDENSHLRLMLFDEYELKDEVLLTHNPAQLYSDPVNPVLTWSWNGFGNRLFIVWEENLESYGITKGLYYEFAELLSQSDAGGIFDEINLLDWDPFPNTGGISNTPSLGATINMNPMIFHLVWEENNQIYYYKYSSQDGAPFSLSTKKNLSVNSGYIKNYLPTLAILNDDLARIAWIGERTDVEEERIEKENAAGTTIKRAVFRGINNDNYFWNFGSQITSASLQRTKDNYYYIAWCGTGGTLLVSNYTQLSKTETISDDGNKVQISSGENRDKTYAMLFKNTETPYSFDLSNNLKSYFPSAKIKANELVNTGREGVVRKDSAYFYYTIGDVSVDEASIKFKEFSEGTILNSNSDVLSYLETESFELNNTSDFYYSVQYGISASAVNTLSGNDNIIFKVKLVDSNTNELISTFDNVVYTLESLHPYNSTKYKVNTSGIGNRTVKLILSIEDNAGCIYAVSDIHDGSSILPKAVETEIGLGGKYEITDYDISQNYPNPFTPSTTIRYQIPQDGMVTLKVYDILGREVKTLVNEVKTKGRYEVNFDASNLASGLYIYEIKSGSYKASKKMT